MSKHAFKREMLVEMLEFLRHHPTVFQALLGPRQVGKTTLARQLMEAAMMPSVYATADTPLPPGPEWIETQWRLAQMKAAESGSPVLLVLDEIQKVQGWSEVLKKLWDASVAEDHRVRLLILGSSALLLHAGLSESLSGRFFLRRCPHWSFPECRQAFGWSLEQWLFFGGYPGAAEFIGNEAEWKQYVADSLVETVLARDVLQLQRVGKPALLRHLFFLSASYPAHILSYNKMLGQLQDAGNTTTLAHYLTLMHSAGLVSGLPQYYKGEVQRRGSSPKLVLWNNALVSALGRRGFADITADAAAWGRLVENAAGAHLLNGLQSSAAALSYWREGPAEVDYVVESGPSLWAIEVKSGRGRKLSGLAQFRRRWPQARALVVGGEGMPLADFFETPPARLLS